MTINKERIAEAVAGALNEMWGGETHDGEPWSPEGSEVLTITDAVLATVSDTTPSEEERDALADRLARYLAKDRDALGLSRGEGALHLALDAPIRAAIEDVYADCGDSTSWVLSSNIAQRLAGILPPAILAVIVPPDMGEVREYWPLHWTKDDKLRDLHARYHGEPGNMFGRDDCGWIPCGFWDAASSVFDAFAVSPAPARDEWEYGADFRKLNSLAGICWYSTDFDPDGFAGATRAVEAAQRSGRRVTLVRRRKAGEPQPVIEEKR